MSETTTEQKSFTSRFDSTCVECKKSWKTGDKLYKVGDRWCRDPNCGSAQADTKTEDAPQTEEAQPASTATTTPAAAPSLDRFAGPFENWLALHNRVWNAAIDLANSADPTADHRGKMIMAQVFYKKGIDTVNAQL